MVGQIRGAGCSSMESEDHSMVLLQRTTSMSMVEPPNTLACEPQMDSAPTYKLIQGTFQGAEKERKQHWKEENIQAHQTLTCRAIFPPKKTTACIVSAQKAADM